jgi:hypothetical protein
MMFAIRIGSPNREERETTVPHEGIRVGEIIAYRAWRVFKGMWIRKADDRLHSLYMELYVWDPDKPAHGDVKEHGICSFRNVIRSKDDYGYPITDGTWLFGKVKIWGEIVEHEFGYRSEFAKIISLDYGEPKLLEKFRKIYRVNQVQWCVNPGAPATSDSRKRQLSK